MRLLTLAMALLTVLSIGCAKKSSDETPGSTGNPPGQTFEELLKGNWARFDCQPAGGGYDRKYAVSIPTTGSYPAPMTITYMYFYSGSSCSNPSYSHSFTVHYDFNLLAPSNPNGIAQIDLLVWDVVVTPGSASVATYFNNVSYLGKTNWVAGQDKTFTSFPMGYDFPEDDYTILKIANNKLYWGDYASGAGTNPGNRPTVIDPTNYENRY